MGYDPRQNPFIDRVKYMRFDDIEVFENIKPDIDGNILNEGYYDRIVEV